MCIINFIVQQHYNYSIVFFPVGAHFIVQKNYLDYVITKLGHVQSKVQRYKNDKDWEPKKK